MTDEEKKIRKKESDKRYSAENPDKVRIKNAKYRACHLDEMKAYQKEYRAKNPEKMKKYQAKYDKEYHKNWKLNHPEYFKEYYKNNAEILKEKRRENYDTNITDIRKRNRDYVLRNFKTIKERHRDYEKLRYWDDPIFRMKTNLRTRTRRAFDIIKKDKPTKTTHLLGTTYDVVKQHIEQQFQDGMGWDNYGKWQIDHIIPLSSAKDIDELIALCHYSNLQPLWADENMRKSNKLNWTREKVSQTNQPDTIERSIPERQKTQ